MNSSERRSVPYRSRWRYLSAPLAVGVVMLSTAGARLLNPVLFGTIMICALTYGAWCLRDWPIDRVEDWIRRASASRSSALFGRRIATTVEAELWLTEHPGQRDRASASALVTAGRIEEGLALLDSLPDADIAANRFHRQRLSAVVGLASGDQPNLTDLQAAIRGIDDPGERLYAEAILVQLRLLQASYGDAKLKDVRRAAWRIGRRISLPKSRELTLLYWAFAGVVVGILLYAYEFAVGGLS